MKNAFAAVTLLLLWSAGAQAHDGNPDNKLVKLEGYGDWEVWCIDYGGTGDIRCNLNNVLVYKPRPDFRALIPRVYYDGESYRIEFATEWQTSLGRGRISVDGRPVFNFADCGSPCVIELEAAKRLLDALAAGSRASIRFHDYLVQVFDVEIDLHSFSEGLRRLVELQTLYGRASSG